MHNLKGLENGEGVAISEPRLLYVEAPPPTPFVFCLFVDRVRGAGRCSAGTLRMVFALRTVFVSILTCGLVGPSPCVRAVAEIVKRFGPARGADRRRAALHYCVCAKTFRHSSTGVYFVPTRSPTRCFR